MITRLLTMLLTLAAAGPAAACSCVFPEGSRPKQVRMAFEQADFVYSAYVDSISPATASAPRKARLRIMQVWKGDLEPDMWLEVTSDSEQGICGTEVQPDTAILAYLNGPVVTDCTLTGSLSEATQDIGLLNRLYKRRP